MDDANKPQKTEELKALRRARKNMIQRATEQVKEQKKAIKAIRDVLAGAACTVPEMALATGMGTELVLWYVSAMKKYGEIVESEKDDSYYRYALAPAKGDAHGTD
ncbi:MAG: hypothetical protein AB7S77_20635 [Desulfatirhabdiaceae bacterium]